MECNRVALKEPLLLELGLVKTNTKGRVSENCVNQTQGCQIARLKCDKLQTIFDEKYCLPEVVVLLLLFPPYKPLIIAGALRINLNRDNLNLMQPLLSLHSLNEVHSPSFTCPVGWLLKSLNPDSLGPLITFRQNSSVKHLYKGQQCTSQLPLTMDLRQVGKNLATCQESISYHRINFGHIHQPACLEIYVQLSLHVKQKTSLRVSLPITKWNEFMVTEHLISLPFF